MTRGLKYSKLIWTEHYSTNAPLPSVWHDLRGEVVRREQFVWGSVVRF